MLTFERSTDYPLIRAILTEPQLFRRMRNDKAPERERFDVGPREGLIYIIARDRGAPVAVFILATSEYPPGFAEVHFAIRQSHWGFSADVARQFIRWVWGEFPIYTLVGNVPTYNPLARRLAESVGFRQFATLPNAGTRNNVSFSLMALILERPAKEEAA